MWRGHNMRPPRPPAQKMRLNSMYGKQARKVIMSQALWCDIGNHAFSAKDPDRQHYTQTRQVKVATGDSYGQTTYQNRAEITDEIDVCGLHSKGVFEPKSPIAELEAENERLRYMDWKMRKQEWHSAKRTDESNSSQPEEIE